MGSIIIFSPQSWLHWKDGDRCQSLILVATWYYVAYVSCCHWLLNKKLCPCVTLHLETISNRMITLDAALNKLLIVTLGDSDIVSCSH